jgi:uncharacterized protein YjbI with pentapeptide repeats
MNDKEFVERYQAGECDFREADLAASKLKKAGLPGTTLTGAKVTTANFTYAIMPCGREQVTIHSSQLANIIQISWHGPGACLLDRC